MKHPVLIFVLFLAFTACSTPVREKVIGKWQLSKVGKETLSSQENNASVEFTKDGQLFFVVDGDSSKSKWEISADEKAIVLVNEKNEKKNWDIITISDNRLVCIIENDTSTLIK